MQGCFLHGLFASGVSTTRLMSDDFSGRPEFGGFGGSEGRFFAGCAAGFVPVTGAGLFGATGGAALEGGCEGAGDGEGVCEGDAGAGGGDGVCEGAGEGEALGLTGVGGGCGVGVGGFWAKARAGRRTREARKVSRGSIKHPG